MCAVCDIPFDKPGDVLQHVNAVHLQISLECRYCSEPFTVRVCVCVRVCAATAQSRSQCVCVCVSAATAQSRSQCVCVCA